MWQAEAQRMEEEKEEARRPRAKATSAAKSVPRDKHGGEDAREGGRNETRKCEK
jgi:hypothetical protein